MQKSKILCLQRNMQNACIEFALLIQRSYCASMHLVLIVDNWPLNHRYYTSLKTASADQKFLITTTENILRFFNTQYWSELFSDYWKPQMTFCSCCEEFLICTQTYRWRYMTLTLIDSTAFFLLSWYATTYEGFLQTKQIPWFLVLLWDLLGVW